MSQKRPVSIILGPADPESCREPLKGKRRGFSEAFAGFWKGPGWEAPGRPLGGAWEAPGRSGGRRRPRTRPKCQKKAQNTQNRENGPGPPPSRPSRVQNPPAARGPEGQGDPPGSPENSISVLNGEGFGV